jgi:hypothetical protein
MSSPLPPTLYYNSKTDKWTEEEILGARTWQHKTLLGYQSWKRAQANRAQHLANCRALERRRRKGQRQHVMECLMALLTHWENDRCKQPQS